MSDNKKYYYLKLKENFFETEEIKMLESMDNGYKYSNILLKLYLRSLKRDGLLMFKDKIPYNPKMIATITGHNVNDVKQALHLFEQFDLIERLPNGVIYMMDIQNFIGSSSTEADRIRAYRNEIENKKQELLNGAKDIDFSVNLEGDNNDDVTNVQQTNDISTPEKELEKELDLDLESEKELKPTKKDLSTKTTCQPFPANDWPPPSKLPRNSQNHRQYPKDFEDIYKVYPDRPSEDKGRAYKKVRARLNEGISIYDLSEAAMNYRKFCEIEDKIGTQYVKMMATFFGSSDAWVEFQDYDFEKLDKNNQNIPTRTKKMMERYIKAGEEGN